MLCLILSDYALFCKVWDFPFHFLLYLPVITFLLILCTSPLRLLRLLVLHSHGIHSHLFHPLHFQRSVAVVCRSLGDLIYDVHALCDLSESRVSAVQMGRVLVHDKELASC